jgi:hypothetical protein
MQLDRYRVILLVPDSEKCEYLKDPALHLEHTYMSTYVASYCRISLEIRSDIA